MCARALQAHTEFPPTPAGSRRTHACTCCTRPPRLRHSKHLSPSSWPVPGAHALYAGPSMHKLPTAPGNAVLRAEGNSNINITLGGESNSNINITLGGESNSNINITLGGERATATSTSLWAERERQQQQQLSGKRAAATMLLLTWGPCPRPHRLLLLVRVAVQLGSKHSAFL